MKKFLSFLLGAAVAVALVPMAKQADAASCGADQVKVVVHYQAFDGAYDGAGFYGWEWTNGTGIAGLKLFSNDNTDDFGAVREICIDKTKHHATAEGDNPGMAFFYANADLNGDGTDVADPGAVENGWNILNANRVFGKDQNVPFDGAKYDAAWQTGEVHIYYYQQQAKAAIADGTAASQEAAKKEALGYLKDGFGVTKVVYYSQLEDYFDKDGNDLWNLWTWDTGTDGSAPTDTGIPFAPEVLYANYNGVTIPVRVGYLYTAADAKDKIGFIVRTDAWEKKFEGGDIFIDVTAVKGSGVQEVYYFAGDDHVRTGEGAGLQFLVDSTKFLVLSAEFLSPTNVTIEVNKKFAPEVLRELDLKTILSVSVKDGDALEIEAVNYDTNNATAKFSIVLKNAVDKTKAYVAAFKGTIADTPYDADKEVELDNEAPVITVNDNVELTVTVKAGVKNIVFQISATDNGADLTGRAYVKEGSVVDTTKPGSYTVTVVCQDDMGNVAEVPVTVVVTDNCATETKANFAIFGLLPFALVAGVVAFRKFNM